MPKKTIARSILELLGKNLNARGVSKVLGVPRDTVAGVQALSLQPGRPWDDIPGWDGGRPGPAMGYAEPAYLFAATMPYSQVSYGGSQPVWMEGHGFPAMWTCPVFLAGHR